MEINQIAMKAKPRAASCSFENNPLLRRQVNGPLVKQTSVISQIEDKRLSVLRSRLKSLQSLPSKSRQPSDMPVIIKASTTNGMKTLPRTQPGDTFLSTYYQSVLKPSTPFLTKGTTNRSRISRSYSLESGINAFTIENKNYDDYGEDLSINNNNKTMPISVYNSQHLRENPQPLREISQNVTENSQHFKDNTRNSDYLLCSLDSENTDAYAKNQNDEELTNSHDTTSDDVRDELELANNLNESNNNEYIATAEFINEILNQCTINDDDDINVNSKLENDSALPIKSVSERTAMFEMPQKIEERENENQIAGTSCFKNDQERLVLSGINHPRKSGRNFVDEPYDKFKIVPDDVSGNGSKILILSNSSIYPIYCQTNIGVDPSNTINVTSNNISEKVATNFPESLPMEIVISKRHTGLGFCIEGGVDSLHGTRPISIKRIFKVETDAQSCLRIGDEILKVEGEDFSKLTHFEAWKLLKSFPEGPIHLTIIRR